VYQPRASLYTARGLAVMPPDFIELRGVAVGYQGKAILPPVDLKIGRGMFLGVVGHSGSGKSTLVRTLLGLIPPVTGSVHLPLGRRPRFGYLPQRSVFEPSFAMTTLDMVVMGRYPRIGLVRRVRAADRQAARELLAQVGLEAFTDRPVQSLSGGQRQRALIARALITDPEVLVLDEPTNGLDVVAERAFLSLVERFQARTDFAVVMISHELPHVASFASEVLLVDAERGAVEQGTVDEVITEARLSQLYGARIVVQDVHGHRAVFLDCEHEAPHPGHHDHDHGHHDDLGHDHDHDHDHDDGHHHYVGTPKPPAGGRS
jgi:ABC-type Mn2+/Zn2+ transport system ATPase subunit